jgi:hypothetical protein
VPCCIAVVLVSTTVHYCCMYVCLIPYSSTPSLTPSTSHHTHPAIPSSTSQRVRLAHLPSCHARRPSNLPYARALPRQTAASSSTTLEGRQNSRTRNRPRSSCSVLRPLVGPTVPDRQHEQRASIPQPCSPSMLLVCPGSLPASRNCYRRPVRPSRSFKTCHPYHATHATHHSAMHDTPSPPCAHRDRSSAMIFSSSLCTYPAAQKQCIIVQGCLPPHWAPQGPFLHLSAPDVAHKAAGQARELASAETLAPARPISSQTSIAHLTQQPETC